MKMRTTIVKRLSILAATSLTAAVAQASVITLYEENFEGSNNALLSTVDWSTPDNILRIRTVAVTGGVNTPDGDNSFIGEMSDTTGPRTAITSEFTVLETYRTPQQELTFTVDWASNQNRGFRFVAQVGGEWYGSAPFGTDIAANTLINGRTLAVSEWATQSVEVETADWYLWTGGPNDYAFPAPANQNGYTNGLLGNPWSTTAESLPTGDITGFGLYMGNDATAWNTVYAADNFRVSIIPEPGTIALLGLAGLVLFIRRRSVK